MKSIKYFVLAGIAFFFGARFLCAQNNENQKHDHANANKHMHSSSFDDLVERFESEGRNEWQKPEEVVKYLGKIDGKTIMDIGSGTGYFSFRLSEAGAKVICGDVDDRFLDYINKIIKENGLTDDEIQTRKLPYDSPQLIPKEVDMVFTVNTYHHIENRTDYFSKVKVGLKRGGKLVIIDFFKKDTPVGPPVKMKMSEQEVVGELLSAGFTKFEINKDLLPYQYIIIAK